MFELSNMLKEKYLIVFSLIVVIALGLHVRSEDYSQWQQNKKIFFVDEEPAMINGDGYYYLRLAQDILHDKYHVIDEKRLVGDRVKRPVPAPLISQITALTSSFFGASLEKIAVLLSPILGSLIAIITYLLTRAVGVGVIGSLVASLLSVLSITFFERTRLGFYDTDSMNVIFPLMESYFFLRFTQIKTFNRYYFLIAGLSSFLLFLIWWNQAYIVVFATFVVPFLLALWHCSKQTTNIALLSGILLIFVTLLSMLLFRLDG